MKIGAITESTGVVGKVSKFIASKFIIKSQSLRLITSTWENT